MRKDEIAKIEESIKILRSYGYLCVKLSSRQLRDSEECDRLGELGEDMDCTECSCSCCLLQQ